MTGNISPDILNELLEDLLDEIRVRRVRRVPSSIRSKRRRYYRKKRGRIKRMSKRRARRPKAKRLAKRRTKIRRRLRIKPGSRRRLSLSMDKGGALMEGMMKTELLRGFNNVIKLVEAIEKKPAEVVIEETNKEFPDLPLFKPTDEIVDEAFAEEILGIKKPVVENKVSVYDNGGKTFDRYTLVVKRGDEKEFYSMSFNAKSAQGVNMLSGTEDDGIEEGPHLGKKISLKQLPDEVQKAIKDRVGKGHVSEDGPSELEQLKSDAKFMITAVEEGRVADEEARELLEMFTGKMRSLLGENMELKLWKPSENYLGADMSDYYVGFAKSRDSEALERSNFDFALQELGGEKDGKVEVGRFGHWASGWVEAIFVHKDAKSKVAILKKLIDSYNNYPVLDEDGFYKEENDEAEKIIKSNMSRFIENIQKVLGDKKASKKDLEDLATALFKWDIGYRSIDSSWVSLEHMESLADYDWDDIERNALNPALAKKLREKVSGSSEKSEAKQLDLGVVPHSELAMHTKIAGKKIVKYELKSANSALVWVDDSESPVNGLPSEILSKEIRAMIGEDVEILENKSLNLVPGDVFKVKSDKPFKSDGDFLVVGKNRFIDSDFYCVVLKNDKPQPGVRSSNMFLGDELVKVDEKPIKKHSAKGVEWHEIGVPAIDTEMANLDGRYKLFLDHASEEMKEKYLDQEDRNYHQKNALMVQRFAKDLEAGKLGEAKKKLSKEEIKEKMSYGTDKDPTGRSLEEGKISEAVDFTKEPKAEAQTLSVLLKKTDKGGLGASVHTYVSVKHPGGKKVSANLTLRFDQGEAATLRGYPMNWGVYDVNVDYYDSDSPTYEEAIEDGNAPKDMLVYISRETEKEIFKKLKKSLEKQFADPMFKDHLPEKERAEALAKMDKAIAGKIMEAKKNKEDEITIEDIAQYLEQWRDNEGFTDFNLALDRGLILWAAEIVAGAGAIDPDYSDNPEMEKAIVKMLNKAGRRKIEAERKDLLKDVEVWISKSDGQHYFIPFGDIDYFVRQKDLKSWGFEFDSRYDSSGREEKKSGLGEAADHFVEVEATQDIIGHQIKAGDKFALLYRTNGDWVLSSDVRNVGDHGDLVHVSAKMVDQWLEDGTLKKLN